MRRLSLAACLALTLAASPSGWALPQGGVSTAGRVSLRADGAKGLEIVQTSAQAALDWRSFSIAAGERVRVVQPDVASVLFNRVTGADPSLILGQLQANGRVFLSNPRGVIFGAGSRVDVGSLVATTLNVDTTRLADGRWQLSGGTAATGELRAEGEIHAPNGTVALVGPRISLGGHVLAGRLGLAAVGAVQVDVDGDGLIFFNARSEDLTTRLDLLGSASALAGSAELRAAARAGFADTVLNLEGTVRARGLALRDGQVVIDGGSAGLTRVAGTVQARSAGAAPDDPAQDHGGAITVLGEQVQITGTARLDADGAAGGGVVRVGGDYQGSRAELFPHARGVDLQAGARLSADAVQAGDGGRVIVWSDERTHFAGTASVRGGPGGGDGGLVEVSSRRDLVFAGETDRRAPRGRAGLLLLDPATLTVQDTADGSGNTIAALTVENQLKAGDVSLTADTRVTVNAAITSALTATEAASGSLTLSVGNVGTPSIDINAAIDIRGTGKALTLSAPTITVADVALAASGGISLGGATSWTVGGSRVVGSVIGGAGSLSKLGTGTLTLGGVNAYAGGTTVSGGTLTLGVDGALPAGKSVTVSGGTLDLNGHSPSVGAFTLTGGSVTDTGATAGALTATQFGVSQGTVSAVLAGASAALSKTGTGAVTLSGTNTYGGGTEVSDGTLNLGAGGALPAGKSLTVSGGTLDLKGHSPSVGAFTLTGGSVTDTGATAGALTATQFGVSQGTVSAVLAGAAAALSKTGTGAVTLSAVNTYGGGTEVSDGTLNLGADGALPAGKSLTVSGGTLDLKGHSPSVGAFTLTGGSVTDTGATAGALTATQFGVSQGTVSAVLAGAAAALSKTGTGAVTLSAVNTYGGGTEVSDGTLNLGADGALPAARSVTVSGGTLDLKGHSPSVGAFTLTGGSVTDTGATAGALTATQFGVSQGAVSAVLAGASAALSKTGTGAVTLSGTNTYGGGTEVSDGTLNLGADGALPAARSVTVSGGTLDLKGHSPSVGAFTLTGGSVTDTGATAGALTATQFGVSQGTVSAVLAGASAALSKTGTGAVTLSGTNTYGGGTEVSDGTLNLGADGALPAARSVTVSGGTLDLKGHSPSVGAFTLTGGSVTDTGATAGALTATQFGVSQGTVSAVLAGASAALSKTGTGAVTLSAVNTYGGSTEIGDGTLSLGADGALPAGRTVEVNGGTLDLKGRNPGVGGFTLTTGSVVDTGLSAGALTATQFTLNQGTVSAVLAGATAAVSKTGAGTVTLSAANTHGGGTEVSGGTLSLGADGALPTGKAVTVNGGTLDLNGHSSSVGSFTLVSGSVTNTGGPAGALSATQFDLSQGTVSAVLAGSSATLSKTGSGTLTLSATNTYGGGTELSDGTLSLGADGALPTGKAVTVSGGTLDLNGHSPSAGSFTLSGGSVTNSGVGTAALGATQFTLSQGTVSAALAGTNAVLSKTGVGTVVLNAVNRYGGGTQVSDGTLSLGADGALPDGRAVTVSGGTLDLNGHSPLVGAFALASGNVVNTGAPNAALAATQFTLSQGTVSAVLAGAAAVLSKTGSGTVVLNATNTYGGGTQVSNGRLNLGADGALPAGKSVTVNGGTLDLKGHSPSVGAFTLTGGSVTDTGATAGALTATQFGVSQGTVSAVLAGASAALSKTGTGAVTLSAVNTYGGGTEVSDGTLNLAADGALPAARSLTVSGGALDLKGHSPSVGAFTLTGGSVTDTGATAGALTATRFGVSQGAVSAVLAGATAELSKTGAGTVTLSAVNTYGGGTELSDGTLSLGADGALPAARSVTVNGGTLDLNGRSPSVGAFTLASGSISDTGATAGALTATQFDVRQGSASAVLAGNGATLTKSGHGTVTLTGANTYGGGTVVNAGTLQIGDGGSRGSLVGPVLNDAALVFDRSDSFVLSSDVSGVGRVEQAGSGTLVLTGTASHLGGTAVSAGTLQVGNGGTQGQLAGDVANEGRLVFRHSDALSFGGSISGAGSLVQAGSGTLTLTAANTYRGGSTVSGGSLVAGRDSVVPAGALVSGPFGTGTVSVTGAGAGIDLAGHTVDNGWALAGSLALRSSVGTAASAGAIALGANTGIRVAGTRLTLSGAVSGAGALTVQGPGSLWLMGDSTATGGTTVSGATLVLSGGTDRAGRGLLQVAGDAMLELRGGATLNAPVSLAGTLVNAQGSSMLNGRLTVAGNALLLVDAAGLVLSGGLAESGGPWTLTKTGAGPLSLGGVNSAQGTLDVRAGRVVATGGSALGAAATLQLGPTASLLLQADASVGALRGDGDLLLDHFTLATGGNQASTRFDGLVSGGSESGLVKQGLGNFTLGRANTYIGQTRVEAGTLTLAAAGASGVASAVTLDAGARAVLLADQTWGSLTGAGRVELGARTLTVGIDDQSTRFTGTLVGDGGLVKQGLGTLTLAGASSYAGGTTVEAGGLAAGSGSSGAPGALSAGPFGTGAVTVRSGAWVDLAGQTVDNDWTLAGPAALRSGSGQAGSAGRLTLAADSGIVVGGTQLALSGALTGPGALTLQGGGSLRLSGANTYQGGTTVAAGTLALSGGIDRAGTGALRVDTGATLDLSDGARIGVPLRLAGRLTNSQGLASSSGPLTLAGDVTVQVDGDGLTLAGALAETGGSRGLVKTGSGPLTLAGPNSATGLLDVLAGTLVASGGQALGDASTLRLASGSTLRLQDSETVGALAGQGAVALQAFTLSAGANGASTEFAGPLSGTGGLTKQGSGTLTLSGSNLHGGATVVQAGALNLAGHGAAGDHSAYTVASGATLRLQADQVLGSLDGAGAVRQDRFALEVGADGRSSRFDGTLDGSGVFTKTGSGTLTLGGGDLRSGNTLVQQGTLLLASPGAGAAASAYTVAAGATLALQADAQIATLAGTGTVDLVSGALGLGADGRSSRFSGQLQGSGDLVKRGSGTLTLDGLATQTGRTRVLDGTLSVRGDDQLGAAPATLVADQLLLDGGTLRVEADATLAATRGLTLQGAGGQLQVPAGVQLTLNAPVADGSSTGALGVSGGGTLSFAGAADNSHSGGTTVHHSTLSVARDGQLGAASGALQLDGATLALRDSLRLDSRRPLLIGADGGTLQVPSGTRLQIGGLIADAAGAIDGPLVVQGGGTVALDGGAANAYSGSTRVLGSTLRLTRDDQLGTAPALARAGQLQLDGGTLALDLGVGETVTLDARRGLGLGAAGGTLEVAAGATLQLPGSVADATPGTAGALVKAGAGTLSLTGSAANTHSGGTTVLAGSLALTRDEVLGAGSAPLGLDGGRLQVDGSFSLATGRALQLGAAGATIAVAEGQTFEVSGPVRETAGAATLTKTGTGTLGLHGATDPLRSGPTQVLEGTLAIGRDAHLGQAPGGFTAGQLLLDGATLRLDGDTTLAATRGIALGAAGGRIAVADGVSVRAEGVISDAGAAPARLSKTGDGALTLAADNRHGGGTDVLAGTLATAGDERLPDAGALRLAAGSRFVLGGHETIGALADVEPLAPSVPPSRLVLERHVLTVRQSIDTRFGGQVDTGSGQLVKEGPGTLAMAGSGSGSGLFQVNSGMLVSASADLLTPDTTVQVADLATLRLESAVSVQSLALAGTLTGAGRMTVSQSTVIDGGTLDTAVTTRSLTSRHRATVQAPLTVTGDATVDGGMLTLQSGGLLQAARLQLVNGATLATVAAGQLGSGAALSLSGGSLMQLAGAESAASLALGDGSRLAAAPGSLPGLTLSGNLTLEGSSLAVPVQAAQFSSSGASESSAALHLAQSATLRDGVLTLGPGGAIDAPLLTLQSGRLRTHDAQALGAGATALRIDAPATLELGAPATVATLSLAGTVQAPLSGGLAPLSAPAERSAAAVASEAGALPAGLAATQAVTLDGGRIDLPLSTREFAVQGTGTVAAAVRADTGVSVAGTLTLADGGTLATPRLQLDSGGLVTQGSGQLLGAPLLQMAAGTLLQLGGDETLGALVDAAGAAGARVALGTHTLRVGSAAADASVLDRFSGVVSGSGTLVKQGAGTWLLSADQAHGSTRIEAGTLQLGDGGTHGALGSGDVVNDGLLRLKRSDTLTLSQAIVGSGVLEQAGSGTLVLAATGNAHSGATRVLSGTLATPGDERLSDASALSLAAGATLRLGGRETLAGLDAQGAVFLGGSVTTTTGGQHYGAAVTVTAGTPITLSATGQRIDAMDDGNRWTLQPLSLTAGQLRLSAGRRDDGRWNDLVLGEVRIGGLSGGDPGDSLIVANRIQIGQGTAAVAAAPSVRSAAATGDARLDGLLRVEAGELTLQAQAQPGYSLLAPLASGRQAVDPQQGRLLQVADDVISQGAASRVETLAGAGLVLHAVAGGSIALGNVDNRLAGPVQALSGSDWNSAWRALELPGGRDVGQSRITLAGQELQIGGQGLEADLVRLSAGRLGTAAGSRIAARLWYNDTAFGLQNSAPGLVLELLPAAFASALSFGSSDAPIVANVGGKSLGGRGDGLAAGFVELLPKNAASGGTVVFLAGPKVGEAGYSFFNAGAGDQSQLPLFYNGVLPATPQLSGSLSAVASVSENARRERFEETVRTENVAIRLRAGVIAEVGPGKSATGGAEGLRAPEPCRAEAGRLDCPPAGTAR